MIKGSLWLVVLEHCWVQTRSRVKVYQLVAHARDPLEKCVYETKRS